ncbi:hypothetical protein BpHYR1_020712 [Brachionus plicatilis]|uniref:Uncharacterized protein n=1 Tax=Brachionus plicatilis TaxID=10195 RepID=A0A3M7PPN9_BRAPC|nr:hypothetical protein BpHYR1_020712 [Brachionus plicatilis]
MTQSLIYKSLLVFMKKSCRILKLKKINSTNDLKRWLNQNSYFLVPCKMDGTIRFNFYFNM